MCLEKHFGLLGGKFSFLIFLVFNIFSVAFVGAQWKKATCAFPAGDFKQPRGAAQQHPAPPGSSQAAPRPNKTPWEADLLQHQSESPRELFSLRERDMLNRCCEKLAFRPHIFLLFICFTTCFFALRLFNQAQPEELSGDELMEINSRLQNQLNQEKNDMQMKSEELNILIRSFAKQPLFCIARCGNLTRKIKNKPLLFIIFWQMFQGLPAATGKQAGAEKTSRGRERGEENRNLLRPGPLVPDWRGRPTWHRWAGAPEIHVQQSK